MTRSGTATQQDEAEQRRLHFRNAVIAILLAIALLLLALLLMAFGVPDWNADGSRDPYPMAIRLLIGATLIAGTVMGPLSLRSLLLALIPSQALGVALWVLVGMVGLIAAPVEMWLVRGLTDDEDPGTEARWESSGDIDWD